MAPGQQHVVIEAEAEQPDGREDVIDGSIPESRAVDPSEHEIIREKDRKIMEL